MNKKHGDIDKFDFATFTKLMIDNMSDYGKKEFNEIFAGLLANAGTEQQTRFMEVMIGQMKSFLDRYDDILFEKESKKYLSPSGQKLQCNEHL